MTESVRIQQLTHFKGFPVPFINVVNKGIPDFRTMDHGKVLRCGTERLCAICGQRLGTFIWFVGGKNSCDHGMFLDPAAHKECADYAFTICPYLLGKVDYSKAPLKKPEQGELIQTPVVTSAIMGMYKTRSFQLGRTADKMICFIAGPQEEIVWRER